ncbi:MAG: tetratricopeptide repeat protein [Pirellulaceae bacterium]
MNQYDSGSSALPPASSPSPEPYPAELAGKPRFRWLGAVVAIVLIVGIVVGPLVYLAAPGEITRWRIAAAEEKRLNGDMPGALQELDRALQKRPQDAQLLATRARWYLDAEQFDKSIADCDRVLELEPMNVGIRIIRSQALQYLGRHAEAVTQWKELLDSDWGHAKSSRPFILNGLAYARALANVELTQALADIDEAMRREGERHEMLDTRGFLYYRQGDFDRALKDLHRSVEIAREDYEKSKGSPRGFTLPDPREQKLAMQEQAKQLAVILYHRGLAHEASGAKDEAQRDFQRVRELGFEPGEKLF